MRHSKLNCLEVGRRSAADTMVEPWLHINEFVKITSFSVGPEAWSRGPGERRGLESKMGRSPVLNSTVLD